MGSRLRSFNFPVIFVSFCFSSNRLTVLQDRVHCYVPFWRTMAPRTVWSRKADSRRSFSLKLEFYTEISTHVFHSKNQLIWISRHETTANVQCVEPKMVLSQRSGAGRPKAAPHPFTVVHRREKKCQAWPLNIFFYTWIKLSNEPKNKIFQLGIFEKIRFEAFSLLKDDRKLEQNH